MNLAGKFLNRNYLSQNLKQSCQLDGVVVCWDQLSREFGDWGKSPDFALFADVHYTLIIAAFKLKTGLQNS